MKQQNEKPQQINDLAYGRLVSSGDFGVNGARTGAESDTPLTRPSSLPVLIGALARARPCHPQHMVISTLIEQLRNYDRDKRPAMRTKILATLDRLTAR